MTAYHRRVAWLSTLGMLASLALSALSYGQGVPSVSTPVPLRTIHVKLYGARGDGTTDDTVAIRAAVAAADAIPGCVVDMGDPPVAWVCRMVTITGGDITILGRGAKVIQRVDSSCVQIGGEYTVSAVFLCQRGAARIRIDGFNFEQHAEFLALPAGYTSTSNFSPIVVHRADHVHVDNCRFDCQMGRAAQWRGGNYGRLGGGCTFINCGVSCVVGHETDAYYGDGASDVTPSYSPTGMYIGPITMIGSPDKANSPLHSLFLSGCNKFTIDGPRLLGLDDATRDGLYIYASDHGVSDLDGTVLTVMRGVVKGPQVHGTCLNAIRCTGDSSSGTDVDCQVIFDSPVVNVTGQGFRGERFIGGKLLNADIRSTGSPLYVAESWENSEVTGAFLCTSGGFTSKTIYLAASAALKGVHWHDMLVEMPAADEYAINTSGVASDFEAARLENIRFICKTTHAAPRAVQIIAAKKTLRFSNNEFDIQAAGLTNRVLCSIAASGTLDIDFSNNRTYSSNATAYESLGVSINSGRNVTAVGNDIGGMVFTITGDLFLSGGRIAHGVAGSPQLTLEGVARADISGVLVEQTADTDAVVASLDACGKTKLHHMTVKANNSSSAVVRAVTSGVVEVDKVDILNAGTGDPYAVTGTGLIAGDLGSYRKDSTLWTDANLLAATLFKPGTTLWNSTGSGANWSDGTTWRKAELIVTSTTAALEAVGNAINTTNKYAGKRAFNTTTGKPVYATGAAAADVWVDATGATAHTPI